MLPIILSVSTFFSTLLGGLTALRYDDKMHRILGFTAGVLLGVVAFDVLPEIFNLLRENNIDPIVPMVSLVVAFLLFHIIEKSILLHKSQEKEYGVHHHPQVGLLSALALSGHSFLDGVGIGIGFQVSHAVGFTVAFAVIAHDFSDGLNTVTLMTIHKNKRSRAFRLLLLDAVAPVLGALSTVLFHISPLGLIIYLGFFAGFLLYMGAAEILPEAHSEHSSYRTLGLTVLGALFIFTVTRFV